MTDVEDKEARRGDPLRARPLVVFVHVDPDACDGKCNGACQRYFDIEQQVLSNEKVLLGLRAFRCIRIEPEHAATEPLLAETGERVPRLVFLDVVRGERVVFQGGRLGASRVYSQMKKTAALFYEESLDAAVKKHLKLLAEHDKLAQKEFALQERIAQASSDRKAQQLEDRLDAIKEEQRELDRAIEAAWELTLR